MATNGFGSIYPRSYWGVTDAENGFGNVYKDLAGYPTIEFRVSDEIYESDGWRVNVYITNPEISNFFDITEIQITLNGYDEYNNLLSTELNQLYLVSNEGLLIENNDSFFYDLGISNLQSKTTYYKANIVLMKGDGETLSNPFILNDITYLVKIIPTI